mgnify:CR=1 FL=1
MSKQWHGGKGDTPRDPDHIKYNDGWERIFGRSKPEIKARKVQPSHSVTQTHKDKSKVLPRNYKYKNIEE